jgi:hypothetical protein
MAGRYEEEDCVSLPRCNGDVALLDQSAIEDLKAILCDRYTPEELIELLGVDVQMVFERFLDECLELNLEEVL